MRRGKKKGNLRKQSPRLLLVSLFLSMTGGDWLMFDLLINFCRAISFPRWPSTPDTDTESIHLIRECVLIKWGISLSGHGMAKTFWLIEILCVCMSEWVIEDTLWRRKSWEGEKREHYSFLTSSRPSLPIRSLRMWWTPRLTWTAAAAEPAAVASEGRKLSAKSSQLNRRINRQVEQTDRQIRLHTWVVKIRGFRFRKKLKKKEGERILQLIKIMVVISRQFLSFSLPIRGDGEFAKDHPTGFCQTQHSYDLIKSLSFHLLIFTAKSSTVGV